MLIRARRTRLTGPASFTIMREFPSDRGLSDIE